MFGRKQIIAVLCIIFSSVVHSGKSKDEGASVDEVNSFKAYVIGVRDWVMDSIHHGFKTIKTNTIALYEKVGSAFVYTGLALNYGFEGIKNTKTYCYKKAKSMFPFFNNDAGKPDVDKRGQATDGDSKASTDQNVKDDTTESNSDIASEGQSTDGISDSSPHENVYGIQVGKGVQLRGRHIDSSPDQKAEDNYNKAYEQVAYSVSITVLTIFAYVIITVTESPKQPIHGMKSKYSDRISNYELWKLIEYADKFKEEDTLKKAVEILINASLTEDLYTSLRSWKKKCDQCGSPMDQPEELYKICAKTGMKKSVQKLLDLRLIVSNVADTTSVDLEHILWQVTKTSVNNVARLLEELEIDSTSIKAATNWGLTEIITEALGILETWKEGFVPVNPIVMLSLALENSQCKESDQEFFRVPEEEKQPVSQEEVKDYAHTATIGHCRKIFEVIKSRGGGEGVLIDLKPYENEEVLFDTCKMINDWLGGLECSNYEKRHRLEAAVSFVKSFVSEPNEELFSTDVIKEKASGDNSNRVTVAYDLLMTDIKPFARGLGLEESKLQKHKVQPSNPLHLTKGTIGLVTLLFDLLTK